MRFATVTQEQSPQLEMPYWCQLMTYGGLERLSHFILGRFPSLPLVTLFWGLWSTRKWGVEVELGNRIWPKCWFLQNPKVVLNEIRPLLKHQFSFMVSSLLFNQTESSGYSDHLRVNQLMCVSAVREGGLLWLAKRDGMFGRWADESCGVGTAVEICRYPLKAGGPPSAFIQPSLNNALPTSPHILPTQVHPQPLRCPQTQAAFLFCLSLIITYPHSTPVHILTSICCHVSSILSYTPHWKKSLPHHSFLNFFSFSSSLTSTYSPQAWET